MEPDDYVTKMWIRRNETRSPRQLPYRAKESSRVRSRQLVSQVPPGTGTGEAGGASEALLTSVSDLRHRHHVVPLPSA